MSEPRSIPIDEAKSLIREHVARAESSILDLSHRIHANPETGLQETQAAAWIVEAVEAQTGIRAKTGSGGLPTAFRAEAGSGELVITLCAEYDALPGVGHGCGHNIIAAASFGAFVALAPLTDRLGITVRLLGTPAEENAGGKVTLLDQGQFDGTHAALMVHPGPTDFVEMDPLASGIISVEFTGREAHASAAPYNGINALDALTITLTAIGLARQQFEPHQQIHGIVRHGGTAPNIIPGAAGATWMARAADVDALQRVFDIIKRCAEAGALASGAEVAFTEGSFRYANLRADNALGDAYARNALALSPTIDARMPKTGSTDMGNVSQRFPSIHPMIGLGEPTAILHTAGFAELAGGPEGDRAALDGAILLASTVIDAALDETLRARLLSGTAHPTSPAHTDAPAA